VLYRAYIGRHVTNNAYWSGNLDDVRIYDTALSDQQVLALASSAPQVPQTPTNLTASAVSSSQIDLSWSDNSTDETGFLIERSQTSSTSGFSPVTTVVANTSTYSNTGLTPATQYYYRVSAVNSNGNSSYVEATATTLAPPPQAPTGLNVTDATASSISLSWSDNSTNETGFEIERSNTQSGTYTLVGTAAANATTFTNTGLPNSSTYYYRVRAISAVGNSSYTASVQGSTTSGSSGNGPIGLWALTGDVQDASGNGLHGTLIGSPGFVTDNKEGSHALATSGSSQAVNLGTPSLLPTGNSPRTIAGWAKTNTTAGDH